MIFISVTEKVLVDKRLLNIDEVCAYLGIGQTKAREILTKTDNPFTVRLGNRLYANKILLDKWIDSISGNRIRKVI
ncbi:MAG: molybdate-binding protein [Blautia sp.]